MRADWVLSQERRRGALAAAIGLALYLLAGAILFLSGQCRVAELSDSGPLRLRLGNPQAPDGQYREAPKLEPVPEAKARLDTDTKPEEQEPKPTLAQKPAAETQKRQESAARTEKAKDVKAQKKEGAISEEKAPKTPEQSETRLQNGQGETLAGREAEGVVVLKGMESGNAYETSLDSNQGHVGRSLYVPIYLYLPPPFELGDEVFQGIGPSADGRQAAQDRQNAFKRFYKLVEGTWRLRAPVRYQDRPGLWVILEDSGYDLSQADYKRGKRLRPVILSFRVGPAKGGSVTLEDLKVKQSSGYGDVDESVVYGFGQAAFFNNTEGSVAGRFQYRFE